MALRQALGELGWTENTISFEFRFADGKLDRLPALAAELVSLGVDVIVTAGSDDIDAARNATRTIPIVMAAVGDAVGAGFVESLTRPGGNITGQTMFTTEQSTKRLELIKEISPGLTRVGLLWSADNASHRLQVKEMESAAPALNLQLHSIPVRYASELDAALERAAHAGIQALVTMDDQLINYTKNGSAVRRNAPILSSTNRANAFYRVRCWH
jgi:putative ABC transport system substrate-binding protein